MKGFFAREVLGHPIVMSSIGLVVLVAIGSSAYYAVGSRPPTIESALVTATSSQVVADITATGVIALSQNPDLSFVSGGRVTAVNVAVGQSVGSGQTLASLDTASLAAARDQAAANVRAQQAHLDEMLAGARDVDVTAKETAVAQAEQAQSNLVSSAIIDIGSSYSSIVGALHADADPLFQNPDSFMPTLIFQSINNQAAQSAVNERVHVGAEITAWQSNAQVSSSDLAAVAAELQASQSHALALRPLIDTLTQALSQAIPNGSFTSSSVTTAQSNLSSLHTVVEAAIAKLQADQQAIVNSKLTLQSAQDALAQTKAGSTQQQIEAQKAVIDAAQASLNAANAAIANAIIVAPYSGTVSAVHVKRGDIVSPNSVAVSLTPHSALQFEAYLSEVDAPHVSSGDVVAITLDAYGTSRLFPATVVSIDRSPTMQNGTPAYKVVAQFASDDGALAQGMTGNIIIHSTK